MQGDTTEYQDNAPLPPGASILFVQVLYRTVDTGQFVDDDGFPDEVTYFASPEIIDLQTPGAATFSCTFDAHMRLSAFFRHSPPAKEVQQSAHEKVTIHLVE